MRDDKLTQTEIEALIERSQQARSGESVSTSHAREVALDQVEPEELLEKLVSPMESAASAISDKFTSALRMAISCHLTHIHLMNSGDFSLRSDDQTCVTVVTDADEVFHGCLDIRKGLLYSIFDRLLGGVGAPSTLPPRPMTEVECRLAKRVVGILLAAVDNTLPDHFSTELSLTPLDKHAQSPTKQTLVCVEFELRLPEQNGVIQWCLPQKIAYAIAQRKFAPPVEQSTNLVVQLPELEIDEQRISRWAVEHLLNSHWSIDTPMEVLINGQLRFHGKIGAADGRKAVRLTVTTS